jgi:predicted DNA-binding transcriptional regulator AlpA
MARGARPFDRDAHAHPERGRRARARPRGTRRTVDEQLEPESVTGTGDDQRLPPASNGGARRLQRANHLPPGLPPRCLSREQAAAYLGIGEDLFDRQVQAGVLPRALPLGSRRVWDRAALDGALDLSGLAKDPTAAAATPGKAAALEALRGSR